MTISLEKYLAAQYGQWAPFPPIQQTMDGEFSEEKIAPVLNMSRLFSWHYSPYNTVELLFV